MSPPSCSSATRCTLPAGPSDSAPPTSRTCDLPCLFVSGRRDAFATPAELEQETEAIPGAVTLVFVDGDHSLRKSESAVADIVASWLAGLT